MVKYVLLTLVHVMLYAIIAVSMVLGFVVFMFFNAIIIAEEALEAQRRKVKEQLGVSWRRRKVKT